MTTWTLEPSKLYPGYWRMNGTCMITMAPDHYEQAKQIVDDLNGFEQVKSLLREFNDMGDCMDLIWKLREITKT